jgi:hypothetical protein
MVFTEPTVGNLWDGLGIPKPTFEKAYERILHALIGSKVAVGIGVPVGTGVSVDVAGISVAVGVLAGGGVPPPQAEIKKTNIKSAARKLVFIFLLFSESKVTNKQKGF